MVLKALTDLYYSLMKNGEISRPGWAKVKIGLLFHLDEYGTLIKIENNVEEIEQNGKTVALTKSFTLPLPEKRGGKYFTSNFLYDNGEYVLGILQHHGSDNSVSPENAYARHKCFVEFHHKLLDNVNNETAKAILFFLDKWTPEQFDIDEMFEPFKEALVKGANIAFCVNGQLAHEDEAIAAAWQDHYDNNTGKPIRCMITGENDTLALIHPAIKGVKDAQATGANLVSFNAESFCSYGHSQGENAPIGKKTAFAYTTALNYLISDFQNVSYIGDTAVLCWSEGHKKQYENLTSSALFGKDPLDEIKKEDVRDIVKKLAKGEPCPEYNLDPDTTFYVLGIAPNASRLSVRFFYRNSFGRFMKNVSDHYERLKIVGCNPYIPLWALLKETINLNTRDKKASPLLAGDVTRAILEGTNYPATLLESTMVRIRAERNITPGRAAIIKAYYTKNQNPRFPKEVLTVSLNETSTNIPYNIGRLFAVYEMVQKEANQNIQVTIKDKYFNSVSATPSHIIPLITNLYNKHLRKIKEDRRAEYEFEVEYLMGTLGDKLPTRLTLPEQGAFQLGYYHQKQKFFDENGEDNSNKKYKKEAKGE